MAKDLLTGFPGFLGSELVRRILARQGKPSVVCLVQPKFVTLAKRRLAEIEAELAPAPTSKGGKPASGAACSSSPATSPRTTSDSRIRRRSPRDRRGLPPRRGLRPVGQARDRHEDQRRRHPQRARLRRPLSEAPPPAVRLDLLCLRTLCRDLPRGRPRARPGVQQFLRGDEVPRRDRGARADARRHAGLDLPPGGRHRRQPHRRDAEIRRPLLRHPLAAEAADGRRLAGAGRSETDADQPRAARFRHRRHRRAVAMEGRRRQGATSSPTPIRRRSTTPSASWGKPPAG